MCIPWVLSEDSWLKRSRCSHEAACLAPSSTSQRVDWKGKKDKYSSLWRYWVAKGRWTRCKRARMHPLAFSLSAKAQWTCFLTCYRTVIKTNTPPNAKNNISPAFRNVPFSPPVLCLLPPTPSWPGSVLSSHEWQGYLTPLIPSASNGLT